MGAHGIQDIVQLETESPSVFRFLNILFLTLSAYEKQTKGASVTTSDWQIIDTQ